MAWAKRCYRKGLLAASGGVIQLKQQILLADNFHVQTTDEFKKNVLDVCKTLRWLLSAGCTDEVQTIDAVYG